MEKIAGKYTIQSKLKPSEILFHGTSEDIMGSIEYHVFYLTKRIHPNPVLMNHTLKFGVKDLNFIIEPNEKPNEKAVKRVKREVRKGG